jgi:hypothetical protein
MVAASEQVDACGSRSALIKAAGQFIKPVRSNMQQALK